MSLTTGQVLNNRYRIVRLLGQGGFGAIYRAWDINLKAPCAVKHNTEVSTEAARQFAREASLLANLRHSNMPRVYDYFILPGQGQYLVMDYIEGEDLQEKLDKASAAGYPQPVPMDQALTWIRQVCDALAYLHNNNPPVIHRDLKPANIRITSEGKAYLVDFGIAKVYDPHTKTTVAAKAVTPGFSPPEQYSGKGTDIRSDIYALGATLYALVTGEIPPESVFRTTGQDTLRPPRGLNPAISPSVEAAILKAMEIHTNQRFQRVEEFVGALSAPSVPYPVSSSAKYPQGTGTVSVATMVQPALQPAIQPFPAYPTTAAPVFPTGQEERAKVGGMIFGAGAVVIGGIGLVVIALIVMVLGGVIKFGGSGTGSSPAGLSLTQTWQALATTQAALQGTHTPVRTSTPLPTATRGQGSNATPTRVPTEPPPTATEPPPPPPPTQPPVLSNVLVRIRNKTGGDVNLYRMGTSGETHFLGWLVANYYGEYRFPSLGSWGIQFCKRDKNGDSTNCRQKTINVTAEGQEFSVP